MRDETLSGTKKKKSSFQLPTDELRPEKKKEKQKSVMIAAKVSELLMLLRLRQELIGL